MTSTKSVEGSVVDVLVMSFSFGSAYEVTMLKSSQQSSLSNIKSWPE